MAYENRIATQVAILMCTRNGASFIDEQLASIAQQTHQNWLLIASDDHSDDATIPKLESFAKAHPQKVMIRRGPGKGACSNFLSLANDSSIEAEYYAFSDQDDVWHKDKLQRALSRLSRTPEGVPALYCGRTELLSMDGRSSGLSPLFARPPAFQNAIVQSLAGGNTMVFNRAAKKILEAAAATKVVLHDWWIYQLVSATGGIVYYDPEPMLKYRQHSDNIIGSNTGWRARVARVRRMLTGRFREWNDFNLAALRKLPAYLMTPGNRETLELFTKARSAPLWKRLYFLRRSGVYRQTFLGNFGLFVALILKRI
jgi:glycosyltransferase involved in cell wall biosynthesis